MRLNDRVLAAVGGAWDVPPPLVWPVVPELSALRAEAEALVAGFDGHAAWGWKDPRNSLTLPFWRQVVPGLRTVVCLRNPLACARSLEQRGASSPLFGLALWDGYHQHLVTHTTPETRVVTHYEAWFRDPAAELQRVCDALGLSPDAAAVERALATVRTDLQHHHPSTADVLHAVRRPLLVETYLRLCAEAGPVAQAALAEGHVDAQWLAALADARLPVLEAQLRALETERDALRAERDGLRWERDALAAARDDVMTHFRAVEAHAQALERVREELHQRLAVVEVEAARAPLLDAEVERLRGEMRRLETTLAAKTAELDEIVHSRVWPLLERVWRLRASLVPAGSRREALLRLRRSTPGA
jgi:hypothetical protein